ncbi:MAG: MBL fold metallo-hydrolase [Kiritimatiellae bacterium]|jgi:hydroxyacylglutathione hydrolase|nr:MBL fold metallo-hydrolase [Kiritimatiellia bacterium]
MNVKVLVVGPYEVNCTVLWNDPEKAWVVDPGYDAEEILSVLKENGLTLGMVVLTHSHFDHISSVNKILEGKKIPVYMHRADEQFAFSPMNAMPPYSPTEKPELMKFDKDDGDVLEFGGLKAELIATPGHTLGGWCLYFKNENLLIAGDTLFAGSVGRTDLPGGDWDTLTASLLKLKVLSDDTRVICGHGPGTTIGIEKKNNPYL